ncbi:MAG: peptidoglycan editing factor PgeF [Lachnospiraceae bacterium]|nr:peptidoglycan editing factor PgeF [Lachnospiraceae bacterium]
MSVKYLSGRSRTTELSAGQDQVPVIKARAFGEVDFILHGFSTRIGGVSEGKYASMNLAFGRGDAEENVKENFRIIGEALGVSPENMVMAKQTHSANVMRATDAHRGMGILKNRDFDEVDALVTDTRGLCLVTGHADCIPLFFVDMVRKAVGLAHSGWRGTAKDIAGATVKKMTEEFGSNPKDMIAFVGPGICRDHYEVGEDVEKEFEGRYTDLRLTHILKRMPDKNGEKKYLLNLHMANYYNMTAAGIISTNIYLTDICTCCNPGLLFSHRYTKGERGGMCAFLGIRE